MKLKLAPALKDQMREFIEVGNWVGACKIIEDAAQNPIVLPALEAVNHYALVGFSLGYSYQELCDRLTVKARWVVNKIIDFNTTLDALMALDDSNLPIN